MKIRDLKAVIVDDAAVKSIHIKRALQFCGVENIVSSSWRIIITDIPFYSYEKSKSNKRRKY